MLHFWFHIYSGNSYSAVNDKPVEATPGALTQTTVQKHAGRQSLPDRAMTFSSILTVITNTANAVFTSFPTINRLRLKPAIQTVRHPPSQPDRGVQRVRTLYNTATEQGSKHCCQCIHQASLPYYKQSLATLI